MNSRYFVFFLVATFVAVFLGHSSFAQVEFTEHLIDGNYSYVSSVSAVDINGDGHKDVLGTAWDLNMIAWWKNDGTGSIETIRNVIDNSFTGATFAVAVDLDLDEITDVVGSAWGGREIAWWKSDGADPIVWTKYSIDANFGGAHEVFPIDLDGDNDIDILAAAALAHEIAWWENLGGDPFTWEKHLIAGGYAGARSVVAVDIDDDTDLDVLGAAYGANDITLWYNDGSQNWEEQTIEGQFNGAHMVRAADIDADGDMDVVGAAYNGSDIMWWANGGRHPIVWTPYPVNTNFQGALAVHVADINGDDNLDIAGCAEVAGDVRVWYSDGGDPITWTEQIINGNFPGAWPVDAADIDGDDDIDILAGASFANDVKWWGNETTSDVSANTTAPVDLTLLRCYPNPFNATTTIAFNLKQNGNLSIRLYNISGRYVTEIVNGHFPSGPHEISFDANELPSGIYFVKLRTTERSSIQKIILMK